jgi:hypothetical protein
VGFLVLADPWYDYIALPIAPLLLVVQFAALFLRRAGAGLAVGLSCVGLLVAMTVFLVTTLDPAEGAPIGLGVMFLWILMSAALVAVAVVREMMR